MKRILIVTELFYPETGLINDLARELKRRGYAIEVLTRQPSYPHGRVFEGYSNEPYSVEDWDGIRIHRFRVVEGYRESTVKKLLNYYTFVKEGKKVGARIGAGFDHILVYQTGPLTLALPAVHIKKRYGIPLTVWTLDIWPDAVYAYGFPRVFPLTALLGAIIRKVYRNADNIMVSSDMFRKTIAPYVPGREIIYAPNWLVGESREECPVRLDTGKVNFTFAGNISMAQNLENVIKGWAKAGLDDARLNIVGDGSKLDDLRRLVEREGIEWVVFHGRHSPGQAADLLARSDVLILSLIADEGIQKTEPFKLQSYLKAGKPVYGVTGGAGKEIIEENRLGICARPDDVEDIARGFREIAAFARDHSAEVAASAERLMQTRFDRQTIIDDIERTVNRP